MLIYLTVVSEIRVILSFYSNQELDISKSLDRKGSYQDKVHTTRGHACTKVQCKFFSDISDDHVDEDRIKPMVYALRIFSVTV